MTDDRTKAIKIYSELLDDANDLFDDCSRAFDLAIDTETTLKIVEGISGILVFLDMLRKNIADVGEESVIERFRNLETRARAMFEKYNQRLV